MSKVSKFLIKWLGGEEQEHRSSDCHTADALANTMFGKATAAEVQETAGHEIVLVEPVTEASDEQEQQPQEGEPQPGSAGETTNTGGPPAA
jgi:hypothetical protein